MATPTFLPGKSHEQRNLVGNRSCGGKESDPTEQLTLSLTEKKEGSINAARTKPWIADW